MHTRFSCCDGHHDRAFRLVSHTFEYVILIHKPCAKARLPRIASDLTLLIRAGHTVQRTECALIMLFIVLSS